MTNIPRQIRLYVPGDMLDRLAEAAALRGMTLHSFIIWTAMVKADELEAEFRKAQMPSHASGLSKWGIERQMIKRKKARR